jgi:hypothetical protein
MNEVLQLAPPVRENPGAQLLRCDAPAIRTDAVYVIFTTIDETLAAVRVADILGRAMTVPLTLIHFRAVPYPLSVDAPAGLSPVETDAFVGQLETEGFEVRVRAYLCRDERRAIPMAFKRHSLIVIGGQRSSWPTQSERWRRRLEAAGHFVVFVDTAEHKETTDA